jgi:hypothetical protein
MLQTGIHYPQSQTKFEQSLVDLANGLDPQDEYDDISIWQPDPNNNPQCLAYELAKSGKVMQIGYGGQAGGGKTDLAIGLAGTVFPEAKIFRRTFSAMSKMIERGDQVYPVSYVSGRKSRWQWPGHVVELAHMQHEKHWQTHQGQASALMAFDEAAQFTETMVRTVGGWLRTTDERQHTLLLLCFNPPTTPEGEWIVQFFAPWIDPEYPGQKAEHGEIRWFVNINGKDVEVENGDPLIDDGLTLYPVSRTFIAASRSDNPYLGEAYERALSAMPEPVRTMMMTGDFAVAAQDDPWQVIPTNWILLAQERWRNMQKPKGKLRAVGVDVAHGGADNTVISRLIENWFAPLLVSDTPTAQIAAYNVVQSIGTQKPPIWVDAIGYGAGCFDMLREMPGMDVLGVNVGHASRGYDKAGVYQFANLRAELIWRFREALDPESGEDIALPDDRRLRVQLASMRYKIVGAKIKIEAKEDIKKRLGYSPDEADAVVLAWAAGTRHNTRQYRADFY